MEFVLKSLDLPKGFTQLLKTSYASERECLDKLLLAFDSEPGMQYIFQNSLSFAERNQSFTELIQALGWLHIRDRLATLYLNKITYERFLTDVDSSILNNILFLESKLESFSPHACYRLFLFGFFLEIHNQTYPDNQLKIPENVFDIMINSKHKTLHIDFVLLALCSFSSMIDDAKMKSFLTQNQFKMETLFDVLTIDQKKAFLSNVLEYSNAIHEPTLLLQETV
jgi:hypothetical protein